MTIRQRLGLGVIASLLLLAVAGILVLGANHTSLPAPPKIQIQQVNDQAPAVQVHDQDPTVEPTPVYPLIPPVGPAWVTSLGTGGMGVLA